MKNNQSIRKAVIVATILLIVGMKAIAQEGYHLDWLVLNDSIDTGTSPFYSEQKILYDSLSSAVYVFDNINFVSLHLRCTKYSMDGEKLWSFLYDQSSESDWFIDAKLDSEGNLILMGVSEFFVGDYPFTIVHATQIFKIAASGQFIWKIESDLDDETLYDTGVLFVDSEDNIYTSGWKRQGTMGAQQTFLNKYTPDGELDWQKTGFPGGIRFVYEIGGLIGLVGFTSGSEAYFSRKYTKAGSLVTNHYTLVDVTDSYLGSPGIVAYDSGFIRGSNAYGYEIQKFSHEGQVLWSYEKPSVEGIPNPWTDNTRQILEDDNGNVYAIGLYVFEEGDTQILITKIDNTGDFAWEIKVNGEGGISSSDATIISNNHLYITVLYSNGSSTSDFGILKYDLNGTLVYKTGRISASTLGLEGRLWPKGITLDMEGNILLLGENNVPYSASYHDYTALLRYKLEPTAVEKTEIEALSFSPNPANNELSIQLTGGGEVSIYNSFGQLISQHHYENFATPIKINQLHSGIYIIKVQQNDKLYLGKLEKL